MMVVRWEGDCGLRETVPDITAETKPLGQSPPSPFTICFRFLIGRWELIHQIDEHHEARVLTAWRELHHG
jgi:hypothetical protein